MKDQELNIFLTNDYIYIPFEDKNKLNLRADNLVCKNDFVCEYMGKKQYSPVSGKAYGLSSIFSLDGQKNVLIVENDFIDKAYKKLISKKDLYELDKNEIMDKTRELVGDYSSFVLELFYDDKYDLRDEFLLRDNIKEVLETLDIIDSTYDGLSVKIRLDKKDVVSYQLLFSYLGTYPNIDVIFTKSDDNEKTVSLYDVIDVYDNLKVRNLRDYIYLTVISKSGFQVVKTKRNSNLKDLLEYLNLMSTNILINENVRIQNGNFLLDESVKMVNIM